MIDFQAFAKRSSLGVCPNVTVLDRGGMMISPITAGVTTDTCDGAYNCLTHNITWYEFRSLPCRRGKSANFCEKNRFTIFSSQFSVRMWLFSPSTNFLAKICDLVRPCADTLGMLCMRCARWWRETGWGGGGWDGNNAGAIRVAPNWRRVHTFPCPRFALFFFRSIPFASLRWSPLSRHEFTFLLPKRLHPLLRPQAIKWHDKWSKNWQMFECAAKPSFFKTGIKLLPKTIGNRKRDCVWDCSRTTCKNLQSTKISAMMRTSVCLSVR